MDCSTLCCFPRKAARCKAGGFFVFHQTGVSARFLAKALWQIIFAKDISKNRALTPVWVLSDQRAGRRCISATCLIPTYR
jgi:hypothetical protein